MDLGDQDYLKRVGAGSAFQEGAVRKIASIVRIATGYELDDRGVGVRVPFGDKNFLFSMSCRQSLGPTQPRVQGVQEALSPGINRPKREADHSPLNNAEIKDRDQWRSLFNKVLNLRVP
jgi:hypothetical protein